MSALKCSASMTQAVRYVLSVVRPAAGSVFMAGDGVPIQVMVGDVYGHSLVDADAAALVTAPCRLTVSAAGAQSLAPTCPRYDSANHRFMTVWHTAPLATGRVTISVVITYADPFDPQITTTTVTLS